MAAAVFYGTGKRKTSVARVWLKPGSGAITVNNKSIEDYFGRETSKMVARQSLELTENIVMHDADANLEVLRNLRAMGVRACSR